MKKTNPEKLKVVKQISRPEIVMAVARQPRTNRIFFGGSDFAVYDMVFDVKASKPVELGRHDSYVTGLTLAGSTLISGGYDGQLKWWNTDSRSSLRTVSAHKKYVRGVEVSPDGSLVASVADDMVCRIWELETGRLVHQLAGHAELTPHDFPSMLFACAFTADGKFLATGDKVGHVIVWDVETGRPVTSLDAPIFYTWDQVQRLHSIGGIRSLAFSPDGQTLAVGGIGKIGNVDHLDSKPRIELFDWRQGTHVGEVVGESFKGLVERIVFHPGGEWLVGAGGYADGFLLFHDLRSKKSLAQEKVSFYVHDCVLDETGDTIFAVGHQKMAILSVAG
jgi:WD40 repeat protein